MKLLAIIVIQISSYASIFGLYFTVLPLSAPRSILHWGALIFSVIFVIFAIFIEIRSHLRSAPKIYKKQSDVKNYMCRWLSSGGRAVIFSRDLSWADSEKTKSVLLKKATDRELTIYLEHQTSLSKELEDAGAKIITYCADTHIPRSRFTIIDYGRDGARVAIGVTQNGNHVIQEFESGKHPLFAVAEDLTKFVAAYDRKIHNVL